MKRHSKTAPKSDKIKARTRRKNLRLAGPDRVGCNAFRRLLDSPNAEEITARLKDGISAEDVADWLQREVHDLLPVRRSTLVRQLYRYRDTIPGANRPNKAHVIEEIAKSRASGFNALRGLIELAIVQQDRVGEGLEREQASGTVGPLVGAEIDRLARLYQLVCDAKVRLGLFKLEAEQFRGGLGSDSKAVGAVALIARKYGPDAPGILVEVGKKLHARLQELVRSSEVEGRLKSGETDDEKV